jgi:hypothetical protein
MSTLQQPLQGFPTPLFLSMARYEMRTSLLTLARNVAAQMRANRDITTVYGQYSADVEGGTDSTGLQLVVQVWNESPLGATKADGVTPLPAADIPLYVQLQVVGVIHPDVTTAETFAWCQFTDAQPDHLNVNSGMVNLSDILKVQVWLATMVSKYNGTFTVPSNAQLVEKANLR